MMTSEPITSPSTAVNNAHNVLLIIDAESVLSRYPKPSMDASNPTSITNDLVFFVTGHSPQEIVVNDSNIKIPIEIGRHLHFRARSISLIAEHSVAVYSMNVGNIAVITPQTLEVHPGLTVPAPDPANPTKPGSHKADDHYWVCKATASGTAQCELSFMLVNQQCEAEGFFVWPVVIEITD